MNSVYNFSVAAASTPELVAFWNAHCAAQGKPSIKKFADRKTAETRCGVLRDLVEIAEARLAAPAPQAATYTPGTCPKCGDAANGITCGQVKDRKSGQVVVNEHQAMCHVCDHEFNYDTGKPLRRASAAKDPAARAAKIAASWAVPEVAAARVTRNGVTFTDLSGVRSFRSVCAAFEALGLPMSRHIAFRAQLKAAGALAGFGGDWALTA